EWSSTQPRRSFGHPEDSARIKGYHVEVSTDGQAWTTVVGCATMPSARGVQFIDLGVDKARFVRLTVTSNWSAPTLPEFFNKLRCGGVGAGRSYRSGGTAPGRGEGGRGCPHRGGGAAG